MAAFVRKMNALKKQIEVAQQELVALRKEYVLEKCPIKIGDTVTIEGFAHKGKQMVVDCVDTAWSDSSWHIGGSILKKDGSVGANYTTFQIPIQ